MKVKELIEKLSAFDPETEVAYEHCYIDYATQHEGENLVDLGALRGGTISRWIPLAKMEPTEEELPCLIALEVDGKWNYYLSDNFFMGLGTAAKSGARWMHLEKTPEDNLARQGCSKEVINEILGHDTK